MEAVRRVLLTGFEPFGQVKVNPSWAAVEGMPESVGQWEVHKRRMPVVFGLAQETVRDAIREVQPDLVIACGVAAGREKVTPELVAVNWRMASLPDNGGKVYSGEKIDPQGPAARMTDLDVSGIISAVRSEGIPCDLSLSAGSYVCNDVYWEVLRWAGDTGRSGLFVHVPSEDKVTVEDDRRALHAILRIL